MIAPRQHLPFLALLVVFAGLFLWGLNTGMLGHDYFYFFPKLLDGKWHFLRQGITPFYYTAHFCGGFPEYANPQSLFYSLPQLLSLFLDLWISAQVSIIVMIILGYWGWYRFGKDVVHLTTSWSHVLALIISAHGFHFMHMIAGHLVFQTMPLIGWLLWLLFERSSDTWKTLLKKSVWFSLITGVIMYSGGYMVMIMLAFAVVALLPFEVILHPQQSRLLTLIWRVLASSVAALLISTSKLVATLSFLRYFPREMQPEPFPEGVSTLAYIFKAFWFLPQGEDLYWTYGMPDWGAVHEYSFFLSPVVLLGLALGLALLVKNGKKFRGNHLRNDLIGLVTILLIMFMIQITRSSGWMFDLARSLPLMSSLHVTMRYLYAFSFPLIIAALYSLQLWVEQGSLSSKSRLITISAGVVTLITFVAAYWSLLHGERLPRTLPYDVVKQAMNAEGDFLTLDVNNAYDLRGLGHSGFVPLLKGGNHIYCSEPMLLGSSKLPDTLVAGPVHIKQGENLNLYNPACMIYPEENNCQPGDRIQVSDGENFKRFVKGDDTTWRLSIWQHVGNVVSMLSVVFVCFLGIFLFVQRYRRS